MTTEFARKVIYAHFTKPRNEGDLKTGKYFYRYNCGFIERRGFTVVHGTPHCSGAWEILNSVPCATLKRIEKEVTDFTEKKEAVRDMAVSMMYDVEFDAETCTNDYDTTCFERYRDQISKIIQILDSMQ